MCTSEATPAIRPTFFRWSPTVHWRPSKKNWPAFRPSSIPTYRPTVAKSVGLHHKWFVYRAPAGSKVTIDPPQVKAWEDTRVGANSPWAPVWIAPPLPADKIWKANATFDTPGTYILRSRADDGLGLGDDQLTVTVTP